MTPLSLPSSRKRMREPLRARRRRARMMVAAMSLVGVVLLVGAISYASYLPRFNVQQVVVTGATHVAPESIQQYAHLYLRDGMRRLLSKSNIFLYQPKMLAAGIVENFPRIKAAKIGRETMFAAVAQIQVEERQPFAIWCRQITIDMSVASSSPKQECFLMDDNGFIFAPLEASLSNHISGQDRPLTGFAPSDAARVQKSAQGITDDSFATPYTFAGDVIGSTSDKSPIGHSFAPSHFEGMLALLQFLKENGFSPLGARIEKDNDFSIPFEAGFYIKASFGASAEDLAKNLVLVLSSEPLKEKQSEIEYIDLRFGNRVYFKLKGEAEAPAEQSET